MSKARVVIAVGNSALRQRGSDSEFSPKLLQELCQAVVRLSHKFEIVLAPAASTNVPFCSPTQAPQPLSYEIAMQQGCAGYQFVQALDNELAKSNKAQKSVSLVTRVVVDRRDSAFRHPSYPLAPIYDAKTALHLTKAQRWTMQETPAGFQRLVASPRPTDVIEAKSISMLLQTGAIVVAMGCGGIPVARTSVLKTLKGVEAFVMPDIAAAKLAELIHADIFVSLIDLPNIYLHYQQPDQLPLGVVSKRELSDLITRDSFADAISPKLQTALQFIGTRRTAIITSPHCLELALARRAGTIIQPR